MLLSPAPMVTLCPARVSEPLPVVGAVVAVEVGAGERRQVEDVRVGHLRRA
jgi:hypothetical protein